jgi:hypothetical protein
MDTKKTTCVQRDLTTCSNWANCSRPSGQHDWEDLCDHLMNLRILTVMMSKVFVRAPKIMRETGTIGMW